MFDGYLRGVGFNPGLSNFALSDVIARQLDDPTTNIEQIAQWEVVYALREKYPELYHDHQSEIHAVWPRDGFYPTYMVKQDSLAMMREHGLYNAYELAYPGMIVRSLGILARLGVEADPLNADVPFDQDSIQAQTRNRGNWIGREFLTRGEHILRGRVQL